MNNKVQHSFFSLAHTDLDGDSIFNIILIIFLLCHMHISCNVRIGAEMISIKLFYISKAALYFHSHLEHEDFPLVLMERC